MKVRLKALLCSSGLIIALTLGAAGIVKAEGADSQLPAADTAPAETEQTAKPAKDDNDAVTEVEVRAAALTGDGRAENGYRSDYITQLGPLGSMKLQDTPYSLSVVPQELIKNVQASMPDAIFKINPFTQLNQPQVYGSQSYATIRGFRYDNFQALEDGLLTGNALANLEDKERLEILSGVSGFLYGPASPGGTINYVLKRPPATPVAELTVGDYGGRSYYVHGDFGGPVGGTNNKVAYRLNVVAQDGDTAVDDQSINRHLVSGAVDWRAADNVLVQLDVSHHNYRLDGTEPSWQFSSGVKHPSAPDPDKLWGQKYGYTNEDRDKLGTRMTWNINNILTFRTGYGHETLTREAIQFKNSVAGSNGTYTENMTVWAPWKYTVNAGYAYLDAKFQTGTVAHKVTMGYYGRRMDLKEYQDRSQGVALSGNFTFADPVYVAEPSYSVGVKNLANSSMTRNKNFFIGDTIDFNKQWTVLAGLNNAQIVTKGYNRDTGALTSSYSKNKVVPSVSLIYRPDTLLSTYFTYAEGLEKGGTAGTTTANAGEIMPPMVTRQCELGAKRTVGQTLFTAALFRIEKAFEYIDSADNVYKQAGREVHKGIEFSATGKIAKNLTLVGGLTLMHARGEKNTPALTGKLPVDVAEQIAKLYAEYEVAAVPGLTITGGIYHTGKFAADNTNSEFLPSVTVLDLGARYQTKLNGTPVTYRLNVNNVCNKRYWQTSNYTGEPRTVTFSAQFSL